jgi:hypothetical protein
MQFCGNCGRALREIGGACWVCGAPALAPSSGSFPPGSMPTSARTSVTGGSRTRPDVPLLESAPVGLAADSLASDALATARPAAARRTPRPQTTTCQACGQLMPDDD